MSTPRIRRKPWMTKYDPPEFRRYRNREEALARREHFELQPGAIHMLTPAELAELGLPAVDPDTGPTRRDPIPALEPPPEVEPS